MGARIKNITTQQTVFSPTLKLLVDKPDTGSGDWLQARAMELALLGNTYMQGSNNGINWHDNIISSDTYFRFSTDGGTTWKNLDADSIQEGATNKFYTETKVSANTDVAANTAARHSHSNKSILDSIIDSGTGTNFLADDGTYKTVSTRVILTKTNNYTLTAGDEVVLLDASSNTVTGTLPTAVGIEGTMFIIKCINATYTCTINTTSSQTIDGELSITLSAMESVTLISNGTNYYIL
jgi:hypothetical protein